VPGWSARLVARLAADRIGATFNFYGEGEGADLRRARLADYLEEHAGARWILVAEAPGWRGTRISGVPLTSERQLTGAGPAEATATIVHRALHETELVDDVVLWNVVPTHPHMVGNPCSNRPPTRAEVRAARPYLETLSAGRFPIPVGRLAGAALGLPPLRHPSHGGASAFRRGLIEYARAGPRRA
jgi:hypothetical protein